jgi:hypothetical protein
VKALFLAPIRHLIPFVATKNTGVTLVFPCSFIPKIFGLLLWNHDGMCIAETLEKVWNFQTCNTEWCKPCHHNHQCIRCWDGRKSCK